MLDDLQAEIKDVIMSFETRFRRMKRAGERAFGSSDAPSNARSDEESNVGVEQPEVSILPVPKSDQKKTTDADADQAQQKREDVVADAILGRSEEEVKDALLRAESVDSGVSSDGQQSPSRSEGGDHAAPVIVHEEL